MERIRVTPEKEMRVVAEAKEVLEGGGVILYPTDTLYGLGADAFSDEAVDLVYEIKGRRPDKPMHCVVSDLEMAERYAEIDGNARVLAREFLPGALTIILRKRPECAGGIARGMSTIGIRIPDQSFCIALAKQFGRPFTATSANTAGEAPRYTVEDVLEQLGAAADSVALAIDAGELPPSEPSTVVDLSQEQPAILREGAIAVADIWNALRVEL